MFFSRRTPDTPAVQVSSEPCLTDESCHLERLESERYLTESLDERESEQLETMVDAARYWEVFTRNVDVYIKNGRSAVAMADIAASSSRDELRSRDRNRESWLALNIASAHNRAANELRSTEFDVIFKDNLVNEGAPSGILLRGTEQRILQKQSKRTKNHENSKADYLYEELRTAFQMEYVVRALMQRINQDSPDVLQTVFDPSTIEDLPDSLQRIAKLDIDRGFGQSVLLDNARKLALGEKTPAERLTDYIKKNGMPDNVKKSLLAVKLGMKVMGAPECPFNALGICTYAMAKVPEDQFPEELKRDLACRDDAAAQKRMNDLLAFAKRKPVSRILDSSVIFSEDTVATNATSRKRAATVIKLEKRDVALVGAAELETPSFERVVLRLVNQDEPFVINNPNNINDINAVAQQVTEQKLFKKYLDTYHDDKLNAMVVNAINIITTRSNYTGTDRTITQWANMKEKAHLNEDGLKEQFMRYSGAQASGISGGPIGRNTRIIFSQKTDGGTRYVTIHKVIHKADMKSNPVLR
ncbi:MAG: hypothetical protein JWN33_442 [Candidatus Saccharibacteria bacterium]|nr:hypothetical protein [Candidatus Saccharibacteria bacterium]